MSLDGFPMITMGHHTPAFLTGSAEVNSHLHKAQAIGKVIYSIDRSVNQSVNQSNNQ